MNLDTALLAAHVTFAMALSILLGMQSIELARLRSDPHRPSTRPRNLSIVSLAVSILTLGVFASGAVMINRFDLDFDAWAVAGVISSVVIAGTTNWARLATKAPGRLSRAAVAGIASAQWGAPSFALAAVYLMEARPDTLAATLPPLAGAAALSAIMGMRAVRTLVAAAGLDLSR